MSIPIRRSIAAVTLGGLAAAVSVFGASPAQSLPDPVDGQCPEAYPIGDLAGGQLVDGLTVSSGKIPDAFSGEVLGVIDDGIAAGLDMIVARLTSDEIDRVGGIWAGMSGSPVYAEDGRLIGAVSYGLSYGPSPVAGITPAADMQALLDKSPEAAAKVTKKVTLSKRMTSRVVKSGAATQREAESGLTRLPVPLGVSGMYSKARLNKMAKLLDSDDVTLYRSGKAAAAPAEAAEDEIFAGSNLAASLSYGDFSAVGTGTTTMVCDNKVVGFGHPFGFAGDTSLTLHGADAIYIQEDSLGAAFKVSNPTGPVGVIDQDRLAGIKGLLNQIPVTALVHSVVSGPGGASRTGDTYVSVPDFTPDATAIANLNNMDRVFDHIGKGSSLVHYTIDGHTTGGEPFTVVRTNRYASDFDITYESIFEPADNVYSLLNNEFTDVTIDEVRLSTDLSTSPRSFRVSKVQYFTKNAWKTLTADSRIKAKPGKKLVFRSTLASTKNKYGNKLVYSSITVPSAIEPGTYGQLNIGAAFSYDDYYYEGEGFEGEDESGPQSFDELVDSLSDAPRNDELTTSLDFYSDEDGSSTHNETSKLISDVITNQRSFEIRIKGAPAGCGRAVAAHPAARGC